MFQTANIHEFAYKTLGLKGIEYRIITEGFQKIQAVDRWTDGYVALYDEHETIRFAWSQLTKQEREVAERAMRFGL